MEGYETFSAENGFTGLRMIEEIKPDLIFLDFKMPDMTGIDVLKQLTPLKRKPFNIIMISGYYDEEFTRICYDLGCLLFFSKTV